VLGLRAMVEGLALCLAGREILVVCFSVDILRSNQLNKICRKEAFRSSKILALAPSEHEVQFTFLDWSCSAASPI
jgi:hypothetical protein